MTKWAISYGEILYLSILNIRKDVGSMNEKRVIYLDFIRYEGMEGDGWATLH